MDRRRGRARAAVIGVGLGLAACAPDLVAPPTVPVVAPPPAEKAAIEAPPRRREPSTGPGGESARLSDEGVMVKSPSGSAQYIDPGELHPPPGNRSLLGISPTELVYLDDGTLVVGLGDGTVTALDGAGHRRFSLGFSGMIAGLAAIPRGDAAPTPPAGPELFVVTTQRGAMAVAGSDGKLRWEREITAEPLGRPVVTRDGRLVAASARGVFALSASGEPAFSHASPLLSRACEAQERKCVSRGPSITLEGDDIAGDLGLRFRLDGPHVPVPSLEPTFPITFHRMAAGNFSSVVPTGPTEVAALEGYSVNEYNDWPTGRPDVVRVDGSKATRIHLPNRASRRDVFTQKNEDGSVTTTRPEKAPLVSDALVTGPDGTPWVLARRLSPELTSGESGYTGSWCGAGQVFEVKGSAARERDDLYNTFAANLARGTLLGRTAAAPTGRANLLCFGQATPRCALYDGPRFHLLDAPGVIASVGRVGDGEWLVTAEGKLFRRAGDEIQSVPQPDKTTFTMVAGTSERDVWADFKQSYFVLHFDGTRWSEVAVPVASTGGFTARAPDDVWAANGSAHWDGKAWRVVGGAPSANSVLARSRDDVWFAGGAGLWHGTPPGPTPVRLPRARGGEEASPAPLPLPLAAPETRYTVDRARFEVPGGAPLTTAAQVSAPAAGVLELRAWDRVVTVDAAGKATALPAAKKPPAAPIAGEYTLGAGGFVTRLDGRLVVGFPAAAWTTVAAGPDDAWFAGALNPGPVGEGILFRVRGRAEGATTTRFRAPASLLALSVAGSDAWAVGAGGTVVHVRGDAVARYVLPAGEWLRAVLVTGPDEVWLAGDGGWLLHGEGGTFHAVSHPLGTHATFTGIASAQGALWVVGPSGILRVARRP